MRLTTFTDYSLRMLLYLAAAPGERATIAAVAATYGISVNHLMKVVQRLGRAGILKNTRGRRGGVQLAQPVSAIRVGQVVRLTEHDELPLKCGDCTIRRGCPVMRALREALAAFYGVLDRYTIADLAASPHLRERFLGRAVRPADR